MSREYLENADRGDYNSSNMAELLGIRKYLHQHPELAFKEYDTSAYLRQQLDDHGIELRRVNLDTGVFARITGRRPGPHIALRADIDGLPVVEESSYPDHSLNIGYMHACGHDLHMTALLGAAFDLYSRRESLQGTIDLIFQPAEEIGKGAQAVMRAGALEGVQAIAGIHNNPDYLPGQIAIGTEPMMAGCARFAVKLHAEGTHAGYPHKGTGPMEAMATMMLSTQTIVSRNASPFHSAVLSITEVHGGSVWNVVPAEAGFMGTARFFTEGDKVLLRDRLRAQIAGISEGYGISAEVDWEDISNPLVGDPQLSTLVASHVGEYASLQKIQPSMAGEDFSDYAHQIPAVFAFVGSNGRPGHHNLHSPKFLGLDDCLPTAVGFYTSTAEILLQYLS
ncbi:M20 metallopeptidase family protein [Bifidobacterium sp.]|jgi:amidohydrolase|uniref:M20 metallopeptidase family protein n=1 Tax=Bifidobacterium sp. TaxID=41200 RepID=UPI0025C35656|nr:amidohydrolase [Bifidobacterium sp.]MCI1635962.1 amidohydrolase [Bifidobacterium sp.]